MGLLPPQKPEDMIKDSEECQINLEVWAKSIQFIKTLITNPVATSQMWELLGREMRHKSDEE